MIPSVAALRLETESARPTLLSRYQLSPWEPHIEQDLTSPHSAREYFQFFIGGRDLDTLKALIKSCGLI
jgi:hypothetical protein